MEIWKDVIGYEGIYQVSNFGNVRSLNWRNTGKIKNLSIRINNDGYCLVNLSGDSKCKSKTVHRLVATAFLKNPNNYLEINHIDENKLNNCVSNLEWCTHKENVRKFIGNHPDCAKFRKSSQKYQKRLNLKVNQYHSDGTFIKTWDNSRTIFLETGMSDWSISKCCRGKQKTAYGYIWQYAV